MSINGSCHSYCLELGINLVFIEGCCGIINYDGAVESYKKFYDAGPNTILSEDIQIFEKIIKEVVTKKDNCCSTYLNNKLKPINGIRADAIAMFLGLKDVDFKSKKDEQEIDYSSIEESIVKQAIYTFLKYKKDFQILFLWPSTCKKKDKRNVAIKEIENRFQPIFNFSYYFERKGFYQLFYLLYKNFEWAIHSLDHYSSGFVDKVYKCSGGSCKGLVKIYFLDENLDSLLDFKRNSLRELFNIGFHSAHSCDNKHESLPISQILLNDNSLSLLTCSDFAKNQQAIKELIEKGNEDKNAYSSLLFEKIINGEIIINPEQYLIAYNNYNWRDVAIFYNSVIYADKKCKQNVSNNQYLVFIRKYKYIRFKSRIANAIRKIFKIEKNNYEKNS